MARRDLEETEDFDLGADDDTPTIAVGEPRRRTVRKRAGEPHPLGAPGARHRASVNFDDGLAPVPVGKSSPREDAPAPAPPAPAPQAAPAPAPRARVTQAAPAPAKVAKKIVMRDGKHCVTSEDGSRSFGCYPTAEAAQARLRQIEGFKTKTAKADLPEVLTWDAVRAGKLPETGSGLPASLERDVPPAYRFWKAASREDALRVREALVEAQLFTAETIRIVDGEPRRVSLEPVVKMYLAPSYDDAEPVVVPPARRAIEKVAAMLSDSETPTALFDEDVTAALGLDVILAKVGKLKGDWVIAARDSEDVRKALAPAFRLRSRADLVFATSADLEDPDAVEWITSDRAGSLVKFATGRDLPRVIVKAKAEEERIVVGVVLEPDEVDAQGDTISKEEIRKAAHRFMEEFQVSGVQHKEFAGGRLKILESWIAPIDFEMEGQTVKEGTWMMTKRVADDELWKAAKAGKFTGFSIGGSAIRKPVKA